MHELRTELDGRRDAGFVSRPNAAADAVARFQNENTSTAGRERRGRGKPGRAGTNHENVMRHDQYTLGSFRRIVRGGEDRNARMPRMPPTPPRTVSLIPFAPLAGS